MKKILVVISKGHLTIYEAALRDYAAIHDELEIDFFILDFPSVSGLEKVKYKLNIGSYKKRYYDKKREELLNQLNKYDTVLFYNIFWDEEYFIQSDLIDSLKLKNSKVYFVDSIRQSQIPKSILEVFSDVFVFEEQDVTFIRDTYQLEAKWVTCGSSYYLFDKNIVNKELKYDVCFVGLGTQKRLEYLDIIAKWCCEHKIKLFVAGHFWHNNHKLNYLLGKLKFRLKHPYLAKFVQNRFIQPFDLAGVYAQSRIVLNINISEHKGFNQRAFDIILCN
uniref:hypothetical protein n=1 Tax=Veillonella ratti TaxID=103892 RepID=UPI0013E017E5